MGTGHPIQQAVRASGVVGDIPADRAGLLAGGIRGEVEAGAAQMPAEVQVHDPRLHPCQPSRLVHLQDAVHAGEHDHDRLVTGHRSTRQSSSCTTRHEVAAVGHSGHHARRHLSGGHGKADHAGPPAT